LCGDDHSCIPAGNKKGVPSVTVIMLHAGGILDGPLVVQGWMLGGAVLAMASRGRDTSHDTTPSPPDVVRRRGSPLLTGVLLGIGIIGFLDEAVFHQLLQWHAFYWATDSHGRILSDGLFHVFSTLVLLGGTFRLWFGTPSSAPSSCSGGRSASGSARRPTRAVSSPPS